MRLFVFIVFSLPFFAYSDVKVVDDYVISDVPIESEKHLLNFCNGYNKARIQSVTMKEFKSLRRRTDITAHRNLINSDGNKTLGFDGRHFRKFDDPKKIGSGKDYYAICKGAAGYSVSELTHQDSSKRSKQTKNFSLVGINLQGTIQSEFGLEFPIKADYNIDFKRYIAQKIVFKHHPNVLKDNQKMQTLIKHYEKSIKTDSPIGTIQVSLVKNFEKEGAEIVQRKKRKDPVSYAVYQKFKGKLERATISYEATTGRIVEFTIEQYLEFLESSLPNVAQQLNAKWSIKPYKSKNKYEFNLSDNWACILKEASAGIGDIRSTDNIMKISCQSRHSSEYLYVVDKKIKSFVDNIVENPPKPPKFGSDAFL